MLAYAYILTSEGYPCVFYKDYSTDAFCFGLKRPIDKLLFIHERIANGETLQRFKDFDVFAYERMGGAHLLVGLNNNPDTPRTITIFTAFGADTELHDYAEHGESRRTDAQGRVTITIPRNAGGAGYVCYSRTGIMDATHAARHAVVQMFEGAQDLDIKPATPDQTVTIARVYCEKGTPIRGTLTFDERDFTPATRLTLAILEPSGGTLTTKILSKGDQGASLQTSATVTGFHTFTIETANTPETNIKPAYTLIASYQAPRI